MDKDKARIAFLLRDLSGAGVQRLALNFLKELKAQGFLLDLVLARKEGDFLSSVSEGVRVVDLRAKVNFRARSAIKIIWPLISYLRREKPYILVSHLPLLNSFSVIARIFAKSPVRLVLVEHNPLNKRITRSVILPFLARIFYPRADAVIAVSGGLAQEVETDCKLKPGSVAIIYEGAIRMSEIKNFISPQAIAEFNHPWFAPGKPPVFLGMGRFTEQKDFETLIYAFAEFRRQKNGRLMILGEGRLRPELEALIRRLGIEDDVLLPGFVQNPYPYLAQAKVFVLSSRWEGLGLVLIEALSCGAQVVATDCPYGPKEILENGRYGRLVAVGDSHAMAYAMQEAISDPISTELLKRRSEDFNETTIAPEYLKIILGES